MRSLYLNASLTTKLRRTKSWRFWYDVPMPWLCLAAIYAQVLQSQGCGRIRIEVLYLLGRTGHEVCVVAASQGYIRLENHWHLDFPEF